MRCSKARHWISRRLDGVLDEAQQSSLAAHLAECEACRAYAESLAALNLDRLEVPDPTPEFTARVMRRVEEAPAQVRAVLSRPWLFRPIAAGLGVAALLGGFAVGWLLQQSGGNAPSPRRENIELTAGDAVNPLAADSIESTLIAMLSNNEE